MSIEQQVRDYILANFLFAGNAKPLGDEDSFLDNGIIDSTGVLELIYFLEQQFQIKITDDELIPENFDSVRRVTNFVQKKQAATAAA